MSRDRFAFALEHLKPTQWDLFENLASAFLAAEFSNLRTVATSSGDKGRDAELFSCSGSPTVMIQYSIAADWQSKIRDTARTIDKNFPNSPLLIYVTNQKIGAKADDLRTKTRDDHRLILDIRDNEWFLDRYRIDPDRENIADDFAKTIVDPLLSESNILKQHVVALSGDEARCALLYLQLQWEDDTREKGLTKLCFDALVKAVLRGTDSDTRLPRAKVIERVQDILPSHDEERIGDLTNTALQRLRKKSIRHWTKEDEFCLSYDENKRISEKLVSISIEDELLCSAISSIIKRKIQDFPNSELEECMNLIRLIVEKSLLKRGELFAVAVNSGNFESLDLTAIRDVAIREISQVSKAIATRLDLDLSIEICGELLIDPEPELMPCLRRLADAYTLMAFLKETPDVQSSINKMFRYGEIWLDTSVILPLLAEELITDRTKPFTMMMHSAREAGIDLFVTQGVLEEACAHIRRCFAYHYHKGTWYGRVPFLYAAQAINGGGSAGFTSWVDKFTGPVNPQEDMAEYLEDFFGIKIQSLYDDLNSASNDVRDEITERWLEIHEQRRNTEFEGRFDHHLAIRLAEHDTENYVGILQRRLRDAGASPFGYKSWWLTLDVAARSLFQNLNGLVTSDPVLSPDFLLNYLAFGPMRSRISKDREASLPLILGGIILDDTPEEVMDIVQNIRTAKASLPERLIRREIRDAITLARGREGAIAKGGIAGIERNLGITRP